MARYLRDYWSLFATAGVLLTALVLPAYQDQSGPAADLAYPNANLLVDSEWLAGRLDDSEEVRITAAAWHRAANTLSKSRLSLPMIQGRSNGMSNASDLKFPSSIPYVV